MTGHLNIVIPTFTRFQFRPLTNVFIWYHRSIVCVSDKKNIGDLKLITSVTGSHRNIICVQMSQ